LIGLPRSSYYSHPLGLSEEDLRIMAAIDKLHTKWPFYGGRKIKKEFEITGFFYNHKRIARLMQLMGIQALTPKRNYSKGSKDSYIYPYLLKNVKVTQSNQVWSSDITYIPLYRSFAYLVAVIDWFSRYVLSWEISNRLDVDFCLSALDKALRKGKPEIFNTDQGTQFTSSVFTERVLKEKINLSMDSRGRVFDNIFIERLWRTVKYEDIYLKDYQDQMELKAGLIQYFTFYNNQRIHQALGYKTPLQIYRN
jgi:putative transposase